MAAQSSLRLDIVQLCRHVHPGTPHCSTFYLAVLRRSLLACLGQFSAAYGVAALVKVLTSGYKTQILREVLISTVRSSASIGIGVSAIVGLTCFFRPLLRYHNTHWTIIFPPAMVSGCALILENPQRWNILCFLFTNSVLERMLILSSQATRVPLSSGVLVPLFTLSGAALLYLLRCPRARCLVRRGDSAWFFYPPELKENKEELKENLVLRNEFKRAVRLWAVGLLLQAVRSPAEFLAKLGQFRTHRLGAFLALYSVIYAVCSWALVRARGRDAAWHALPAGLLAGQALRLFPATHFAVMPATGMLQILTEWYFKKMKFKNITAWKFLYMCLSVGYIAHVYFSDPELCPKWVNANFSTFSGQVSSETRLHFIKLWAIHRYAVLQAGL